MAPEQQIVLGLDREGVAHKGARVDYQSARHAAGDAASLRFMSGPTVAGSGSEKQRSLEEIRDSGGGFVVEREGGGGKGEGREGREGGWVDRYISGSFCVSMTAAMGMPKLETGPQKSGEGASTVSRSCR